MKFWQKIFVAVFLLFFVFFNSGMLAMSRMYYEANLDNEKATAMEGAFFVSEALSSDLDNLDRLHVLGYDNKKRTFETYSLMYLRKDIYLQYVEKGELMFDSLGSGALSLDWSKAEDNTLRGSYNGVDFLAVRSDFNYPVDDSYLLYIYSLKKFDSTWSRLIRAFIGAEVLLILLLFEVLYLVIKRMTKPLLELSDAVDEMRDGNYGQQLAVHGSDEIAGLAASFNQMSSKIEESIETLRTSDAAKQNFIDDLGHELRTPLTSISGYAEYLKMTDVSEEEKQVAYGYIISESRRLQKLSEALLNLALLKSDSIEMKQVPIEPVFERLKLMFMKRAQEKQVELCFAAQTETLYGNEELLYSLLTNLLENGIRAMEQGGVIEIKIDKTEEWERIVIQDNGIGMEKEELKKITEPFYRVDKARSRKSGGVGLGLSLCHQIVECHNGSINYESEPEKGTKVTVLLQLEHNFVTN